MIQPIPKPTPKAKRRKHKDPVTPEMYEYIATRDKGCVLAQLDPFHQCHDQWGNVIPSSGAFEIDHVDNAGLGKRGPSTANNLCRVCPWGHAQKTANTRLWRPALRAYLEEVEADAA